MKIKIDISINLSEAQVEAFTVFEGEPTEKAIAEFILAHGICTIDAWVARLEETDAYAMELPF